MVRDTVAEPRSKVDLGTLALVGIGVGGMGFGLYLWLKKDKFTAGDNIYCIFRYQHAGPGGTYKFRAIMGHIIQVPFIPVFDEIEGTMQEVEGGVPPSVQLTWDQTLLVYKVPEVLGKDKYDLEASIRKLDGSIIVRVLADDIIVVS